MVHAVSDEDAEYINNALQHWRQGDVVLDSGLEFLHLADLSRPLSSASQQIASASERTDGVRLQSLTRCPAW
jgi:hypothetical protein